MPWILIALGAVLLWVGCDALIHLGVVRPLTGRELDRAVHGEGGKRVSEGGQFLMRRVVPAHNALERLLAWVFVLAGGALLLGGAWLLWITW